MFNYKSSVGLLMTDVVTSRSAVLEVLVKPYKESNWANLMHFLFEKSAHTPTFNFLKIGIILSEIGSSTRLRGWRKNLNFDF